jgi:hypothetical protein
MALAFETGGYGFAPAIVPVDQQALQGLKPLSFSGQSPVQFKPLPEWKMPETHPELIGAGITSGISTIAKGIEAIYKSKQDVEKDKLKFERDKEIAQIKANQTEEDRKAALDESHWFHTEMINNARDRIDKVNPSEAKALAPRSLKGIPSPTSSGGFRRNVSQIKTGLDFTKPFSEDQTGGQDSEPTGGKINISNSPQASINVDALPEALKPYASDFESAGNKHGIDPNFLAAIAWNETGGGTSKAFRQGNNAMGISNASGPVYGFASVADSIEKQAATLAREKGPYRGASTIREVGSIYSPIGAANDPRHLNADWTNSVGKFYNQLTGNDSNATVLRRKGSPLADLTSPQDIMEAAPEMRSNAALSALASIPWGQIGGQYKSASGGVPSSPVDAQSADWLRTPKSVTAPLAGMGGVSNEFFPALDQSLTEIPSYSEEEKNKAMEDAIGVDAIYGEKEALALRDYARQTGRMEPTIKATQAGYEVNWPSPSVLEAAASRKARAGELADLGKGRLDLRQRQMEIQTFNQSVDKFNTDPSLKRSKEKLKPVIESFMGDLTELNRMGESYGNRSILDQSLIDQYVRFATGNVPTHNQYEMLTANRPLFSKLQTLFNKNVPASSKSLLEPQERKQMANSMVKVLNMEHDGLNTKVANERRIVDKLKSQKIDENNKPHRFPILKTDEDVQKEVNSAATEMEKAWGGSNNKAPKDPEAYKQAVQKHKKALADYEIAKMGVPSNLDDLSKYGEEIDGIYYPAGWSGRLIYEDDSAYRPLQNAPLPDAAGN